MTAARLSRLVYGGSFDPVHQGHIAMMQYVLSRGLATRLDIVPAKVSPFKQDRPPTLPEDLRLELLTIAVAQVCAALSEEIAPEAAQDLNESARPIANEERVRILDFELRSPPPSYTARTLRALREHFPDERIGLLVGSDSFRDLDAWRDPAEILTNHTVVVFRRAGDDLADLERKAGELRGLCGGAECEIHFLDNPLVDCSSTDLRRALAAGRREAIGDCLPEEIHARLFDWNRN